MAKKGQHWHWSKKKVHRKSNMMSLPKHRNRILKGEVISVIRCPHCHSLLEPINIQV